MDNTENQPGTAIAHAPETKNEIAGFGGEAQNILSLIGDAARDKSVDVAKMEGLYRLYREETNWQAQRAFNEALARVQEDMPRIEKKGKIIIKNVVQSTYAKYEDIDKHLRPLLQREGFSLRFDSKVLDGGRMLVSATLSHKAGHSVVSEIPLSLDGSGNKNNTQAAGSTYSYGQRYLARMIFNIVDDTEDDSGGATLKIDDEQAEEIKTSLRETGSDTLRFLQMMGVNSIEEILAKDYLKACRALGKKTLISSKSPASDA